MFSPGTNLVLAFVFLALSMGSIAMLVIGTLRQNRVMSRRLAGASGVTPDAPDARIKASRKMIALIGKHLTLPDAAEISKIRFKLSQAGIYAARAVPVYYAIRLGFIVLPQVIFHTLVMTMGWTLSAKSLLAASMGLLIFGMFTPDMVVGNLAKRRRYSAKEGFPDMLDLMLSCLEAGLGLDAALNTVAKELGARYPVLKVNLDLLNLEVMAGRPRHESFKNFADRLGLEEARALTVMLKQSEEMGSSLGEALRTFSDEMRSKRMLLAEEKAMALSAKLTVPLILFIFPTLIAMLILPAAARLAGGF